MSGGSQVHIFWGAPISPLEMTVSQEPTSLVSTADPWKEIQLLYNHHSLHLKDEKCRHKSLKDYQALEPLDPPDLPRGHFPANSVNRSVHVKDDFTHCIPETQTIKSQKSHPLGLSDRTNSSDQICGFKAGFQRLTEEEKYQKLFSEHKKITVEQPKDQSNIHGQNVPKDSFQLDHKCAAILDVICGAEQTNTGPGAMETNCAPTEHHEIQNQSRELFSSSTVDKPRPEGTVRKVSGLKISTDTEFLSVMTSSQVAFLAQRKYKGQNSINKGTIKMEIEPEASHGEIRITEDNLIQPNDDSTEGYEGGQNQACSLELFSPEPKNSHILLNTNKGLEENIGSQELFRFDDKLTPNEIRIESCSSGILCSQLNTFHKSSVERSWTSEDKSGHPQALSEVPHVAKKIKLISNQRDHTVTVHQRNVSGFKGIKKTSLIKNCDSESQKYNCLVMVLSPCHVKEINIKSGPNSGSKVPLATIVVIDQSEIKKKVFLWRTAAFWALTVFLGDIILLTDVTIHEDHWVGETVLQSTFTSHLLNLGSYSSVHPEEYYIWEFKYLFVQRNCILENLELHTTPWSSCECLFDDDIRAITFKAKFQKNTPSFVKMSDLATHLEDKRSGVILIKAQILELVFPITASLKIALNAHSSLKIIFSSLPNIIYTGCAKCGLELETDENKIYKQCFSCLPFTMKKKYYRPALMTIVDGIYKVCVHVGSKLIEKILLNISPDWLNRVIGCTTSVRCHLVNPSLEGRAGVILFDSGPALVLHRLCVSGSWMWCFLSDPAPPAKSATLCLVSLVGIFVWSCTSLSSRAPLMVLIQGGFLPLPQG
ncbi:shieldin complex subunit 2 isoform X8 [Orcinus orca]|uniref:shieldin complex subunit 2 isoform X8 n=1 Tax=Orcinus orca TaxID=9733 RepID=UPI00211293E0|nr:shieldin complex subunit 2 isoform X8 [Orcinus orca]